MWKLQVALWWPYPKSSIHIKKCVCVTNLIKSKRSSNSQQMKFWGKLWISLSKWLVLKCYSTILKNLWRIKYMSNRGFKRHLPPWTSNSSKIIREVRLVWVNLYLHTKMTRKYRLQVHLNLIVVRKISNLQVQQLHKLNNNNKSSNIVYLNWNYKCIKIWNSRSMSGQQQMRLVVNQWFRVHTDTNGTTIISNSRVKLHYH